MYKPLFLLFLSLFTQFAFAQTCDCKKNLDSLSASIENNYSGFYDKINKGNRDRYKLFKDSLGKAAPKQNDFSCYVLLRQYLSFFNDPHLNMVFYTNSAEKKMRISQIFTTWPHVDVEAYKRETKGIRDNLLGTWVDRDNGLEMEIVRSGKTYIGVIAKGDSVFWSKGMVKFRFSKGNKNPLLYYNFSHINTKPEYNFSDTVIKFGSEKWLKKKDGVILVRNNLDESPDFFYQSLNDSTGIFRIRSFHIFYRDSVKNLIARNIGNLEKIKYLLFDVRNNGGGHFSVSAGILTRIFTFTTIILPPEFRVSRGNIANFSNMLQSRLYPDSIKTRIRNIIDVMENNLGKRQFMPVEKNDTLICRNQFENIKRIGILINKSTASTAEFFIKYAKKDARVTLFGEETRGATNYTDVGNLRVLPCDIFAFYCPMSKPPSINEHVVFNQGIQPDVRTNYNSSSWLKTVLSYLASK